ncbi:hypothetical protein [Nonomuraea sp. NPDC048826]|uniref:hypothetical protein n=1 Tax=Nonomuraea sp. NPDC048826 TaxID=3364347 RepID=UPI003715711A
MKIVKITDQSFRFEALDGHVEPTGGLIRFTIIHGDDKRATGYGDTLWLNVKAWGPKEGIHHAGICSFLWRKCDWATFDIEIEIGAYGR